MKNPVRRIEMSKTRLEAFSDGVIAIIITIMVLELRAPHAADVAGLKPLLPLFLSYVLSFIYVGIYWNNHHHMLYAARHVGPAVLWANLHVLFWLSLIPFVTEWMGATEFDAVPTALYGVVLLICAVAYTILLATIVAHEGRGSLLAEAIQGDRKGKISMLLYCAAIGCAFIGYWISQVLHVIIAIIWMLPDRRIEHLIAHRDAPRE